MVDLKTLIKISVLSLIFLNLSSCSLFSSSRNVVADSKNKGKGKAAVTTVAKAQYDELLKKYQVLLRRNRQLEGDDLPADVTVSPPANLPKLAETVDVFAKQLDKVAEVQNSSKNLISVAAPFIRKDMEGQIADIKKVIQLIDKNHFDEALQILKILESSKYSQIAVRSKFYTGEVLFRQGEFDLAMQLFEEVINRYAFSGIVLKTLGRLIICSEKLKIKKKYDLYYSILHDFFKTA